MKKSNVNWTIKRLVKDIEKGTINFDYPIQRAGGQWDNMQQSLLIHSVASDYPIPAIYTVVEHENVDGKNSMKYQIIDGKQRLTNLQGFLNNDYALHEDTPNVKIDGESYEIKNKTFDELTEEVQDAIRDFTLLNYKIEDYTDEEIEDLFFRLNNGTPLSKQQQAKGMMGKEWAVRIKNVVDHPFMKNKTSFTKLQMRKADNESSLIQAMMLMDKEYDLGTAGISSNGVSEYTKTFKSDEAHKKTLLNRVVDALDYLDQAYEVKESTMLKKVHFPMTIINALYAKDKGITPSQFAVWTESFKMSLKAKENTEFIPTNYKTEFSGAGSVKTHMALGRVGAMKEHMDTFFVNYKSPVSTPNKDDSKAKEEVKVSNNVTDIKSKKEEKKNKESKVEKEIVDEKIEEPKQKKEKSIEEKKSEIQGEFEGMADEISKALQMNK